MTLLEILKLILETYVVLAAAIYLITTLWAVIVNWRYQKKQSVVNYRAIKESPYAPAISIIAPAYNEGKTVVSNVKSLLSLDYKRKEVIIVNDGSTDATLQAMVKNFDLVPVSSNRFGIPTKPVKQVYVSENKAFRDLKVIDKENGGKSDALNAGINIARHALIGCMDVDSILLRDSLLKLVKPFLDDKSVIATGGSVRIANSCEVKEGQLKKVHLPKRGLALFQALEYLRAFLVGRMSWSSINGLLLVSGAVGLFRKDIVQEIGGYKTNIVGEDIDLIIRMRKHMYDTGRHHSVKYVPDPVCWTEAPDRPEILASQRNRWNRGAFEALCNHCSMVFNPRYGVVGMIAFPYWIVFEWLAPTIVILGSIISGVLLIFGDFQTPEFYGVLLLAYTMAVFLSVISILIEELTYQQYTRKTEILRLFAAALIEPFTYHLLVIWWSFQGTWDTLTGKTKGWGLMTRTGLETS